MAPRTTVSFDVPPDGGDDAPSRPSRTSFREQVHLGDQRGRRASLLMPKTDEERESLAGEIQDVALDVTAPFESKFAPSDMRQLALVAHNHMKPAMKGFISTYSEVLKKFRITGTQTTMRMCKTMWGEDNPEIEYGLTCTSGPLGGDAQIAALMCMEDLGAIIFFIDPLSAHPHQADIDSLIRLANCGNVIVCPNPTSAMSMMHTLKLALEKGNRGMIPSFFETLESPAVAEYKHQQELALAAAVSGTSANAPVRPPLGHDPSIFTNNPYASILDEEGGLDEEEDEEEDDFFEVTEEDPDYDAMLDDVKDIQRRKSLLEKGEAPNADEVQDLSASQHRRRRVSAAAKDLYGIKRKKKSTAQKTVMKLGKSMRKLASSLR